MNEKDTAAVTLLVRCAGCVSLARSLTSLGLGFHISKIGCHSAWLAGRLPVCRAAREHVKTLTFMAFRAEPGTRTACHTQWLLSTGPQTSCGRLSVAALEPAAPDGLLGWCPWLDHTGSCRLQGQPCRLVTSALQAPQPVCEVGRNSMGTLRGGGGRHCRGSPSLPMGSSGWWLSRLPPTPPTPPGLVPDSTEPAAAQTLPSMAGPGFLRKDLRAGPSLSFCPFPSGVSYIRFFLCVYESCASISLPLGLSTFPSPPLHTPLLPRLPFFCLPSLFLCLPTYLALCIFLCLCPCLCFSLSLPLSHCRSLCLCSYLSISYPCAGTSSISYPPQPSGAPVLTALM